ncbi:Uncharacterised protein [Salmonella enterica subsp. enterica serovar Bovismorbificans]|uniref:Uncharacterized protein n=1 Tax=Salmonella enterica subsp. enterica serovar Bovismorbificans TaxID=58097 RepID=A0A655D006_SALET|nr:Uncharacterised protein [Salmonella enterica subsp. enterica serovar Bovismorbificans]
MAQFMAQYAFNFIIGHQIHQAGVYANATVRHRPCVDIAGHIDFIANRRTVNVVTQRFGDFAQTFGVFAFRTCQLILAVHLFTGIIR